MSIEDTGIAASAGTAGNGARAFLRGPWGMGLLLVLLTLAAFSPAICKGGFVWDDDDYLTQNEAVRQPAGLVKIWADRTAKPQYYPMVFTSYWLEYRIWGLSAAGYHAVNVLLHAVSVLLVWRILKYLRVRGAFLAAALFAVHPVMVESVAWITERKNVLSGVLYLAALLVYLRFAMEHEAGARKRRWGKYALALVLFAAALLSKSVTCTMPAAVIVLLWYRQGRVRWRQAALLAPFFVLGALAGLNTAYIERAYVGATGPEWDFTWIQQILIAGRAWWFYLGKVLAPVSLKFIYPRWTIDAGAWWQYAFPAAALAAVGGSLLLVRRMGRGPAAGVLFFTVTIGPALGFSNVYPMRFSFVADHFQYLASLGILTLAAAGAVLLARRWKAGWGGKAAAGAVVGALAIATAARCLEYQNAETLWTAALMANHQAWLAMDNLALIRLSEGKTQEALELLNRAREIKPNDHPQVYCNLGSIYMSLNRLKEAEADYQESLRQTGDPYIRAAAANGLGALAARRNDMAEALRYFQLSVQIYPRLTAGHNNVAMAELALGHPEAARRAAETALALDPSNQKAKKLLEQAQAQLR